MGNMEFGQQISGSYVRVQHKSFFEAVDKEGENKEEYFSNFDKC